MIGIRWTFLLSFITCEPICAQTATQIQKCPGNQPVFALEREHARLRCRLCNGSTPLINNDLQKHGLNITWFTTSEDDHMARRLGKKRRITSDGILLDFWPVMVNDTGEYSCYLFNGSQGLGQMKTSLTVGWIDEACYDEGQTFEQLWDVGVSVTLPCPNMDEYRDNEENIVWYKDCQTQVHTGASYTIPELEKENAGYYTCKLSLENAGIQYNVTRTWKLLLEDAIAESKPKLIYPHQELVFVDIGEYRTFNCKVHDVQPNDLISVDWKSNGTFIKNCMKNEPVCKGKKIEENRMIAMSLVFNSIRREHLNLPFNCFVHVDGTVTSGQIILQEKGNGDIGRIIKPLFGVIVFIIIVAALCIQFKVEIVLLFRELMGSDETLGDGKEYDAYVLLLKSGRTLVSAEEEQFALELLPAVLEKQLGYRLCIFERDVPPGGACADNVFLSIQKCRRLIIILCDEWVAVDDSSMYELMTGLHQALVERIIKPILVEFKPIKNYRILPESLQLVCKSKRMVKWRGAKSVSKKSSFWKKMHYLMPAKPAQLILFKA